MQKLLLVTLCNYLAIVSAHSWLHCTDYRIQSSAQVNVFAESQCRGYGRAWSQCCENTPFGLDRGYNYQPNGGRICRNPLNTANNYNGAYSTNSPMATYAPGQQVCLAWAPKNHVAASCINNYIPDNGMQVYMSGPNPTSDPTSLSQMTKVADWGKNPSANAYKGFQHCPNFCSNPDKATCTGCFYIPSNARVGAVYTFVWTWEFNSPSDQYSTCWEARIVSSTQGTALNLPARYPNVAGATSPIPTPSTPIVPPAVSSTPVAPPTPIATSTPAVPSPPGQNTCSARWQCQQFSSDYNYVDCVNGVCTCLDTFAGSATSNNLCRCDKSGVIWSGSAPKCLAQGQCIGDFNGVGCTGRCQNMVNGVGTC